MAAAFLGIDDADLLEFVCVPSTKGVNVQHLDYRRRDGTELAAAQRHSKGFASKLTRFTGTDEGKDRDIRLGDDLTVLLRRGNRETGSTGTIEAPAGTAFGTIRLREDRYVFELPDGTVVGGVEHPEDDLAGGPAGRRHLVDGTGTRFGVVDVSVPGQPSAWDLLMPAGALNTLGTQGWTSRYTSVLTTLEGSAPPPEPLRTFVVAFPIALALGYRRPAPVPQ